MDKKFHFQVTFLKNKLSLIIYILTAIWILGDVHTRFFTIIKSTSSQQPVNNFKPFISPQINEKQAIKLSEKYKKFQVIDEIANESTLRMPLSKQTLQQGKLNILFLGDNKLKLKAVIQTENSLSQDYYALIEVENIVKKTKKIAKYYQDDKVLGYKLSIKNNTQVNLFPIKNNMNKITLVMYKN